MHAVFYAMRDTGPGASTRAASLQALSERFVKLQAQAGQLSKPNEFGARLKRAGAVGLNAATSADATRYFVSLPTNALELWFAMEAERFQVGQDQPCAEAVLAGRMQTLGAGLACHVPIMSCCVFCSAQLCQGSAGASCYLAPEVLHDSESKLGIA